MFWIQRKQFSSLGALKFHWVESFISMRCKKYWPCGDIILRGVGRPDDELGGDGRSGRLWGATGDAPRTAHDGVGTPVTAEWAAQQVGRHGALRPTHPDQVVQHLGAGAQVDAHAGRPQRRAALGALAQVVALCEIVIRALGYKHIINDLLLLLIACADSWRFSGKRWVLGNHEMLF